MGILNSIPISNVNTGTSLSIKLEAYITFYNDKDAYFAMIDNIMNKSNGIFKISPADTWHQPQVISFAVDLPDAEDDPMESTSRFVKNLPNECLLKIFEYCDIESLAEISEVGQSFSDIVHTHLFPAIKEFSTFGSNSKGESSLAVVRKILRCIGSYVNKVDICWSGNKKRLLQKVVQHVTNVLKMRFDDFTLTYELLQIIKPILIRLHTLKYILYDFDAYEHVHFEKYCPNLVKLSLTTPDQILLGREPWPTLKILSLHCEVPATQLDIFYAFIKLNPQLKCSKAVYQGDSWLKMLIKYLPSLEKIRIQIEDFPMSAAELIRLKSLKHLKQLLLCFQYILNENEKLEILHSLIKFTKLRLLNICFLGNSTKCNGETGAVVKLAQQLPNLEIFEYFGGFLDQATVVTFVQYAKRLKEINTPKLLLVTKEYLTANANARKSIKQSSTEPCIPLKLILQGHNHYPKERLQWLKDMQNDSEIQPYLTLSL